MTTRAAREATSLALLGAPEARCSLPERAFVEATVVFGGSPNPVLRGRRCPAGAISGAARSAGLRSARAARFVI
jgi:hypothetical protein